MAPALLDAGIGELFIVNRTPERADALADALGEPGRVHTRYWDDLPDLGAFDLHRQRHLGRSRGQLRSALPFAHRHAAHPGGRPELWRGRDRLPGLGTQPPAARDAIDGLGMLVEQAAESFELWHGVRPATDAIYAELRSQSIVLSTGD